MPKRQDIKKIMLIGSGPIVIGQGCEFDYSGVQACKALKNEGFEVILVNSNPATIMTDPEFADRTYIEPLTLDILHEIIRRERPDALLPTLGGQTALNLAMELHEKGILKRYQVELIGATAVSIEKAEDRQQFKQAMIEIGLELPISGSAHDMNSALAIAETIGTWPLIIRPGFTLGGTGGGIAYNKDEFTKIVSKGLQASKNSEVLIEESLLGWKEYEMEVMRDKKGNAVIVCSIENLDPMGTHTGDSITVAPIQTLTDAEYQQMRDASLKVMEIIGVETGGSNVQWAVNPKTGKQIVIEMNPRVSRSSALASKATGFPIAKIAALLAVGYTLDEIMNDITGETPSCFEPAIDYVVTKIPRFTFEKFSDADKTLGTQMKSVGEAMAIGRTFKQSFQKALRSLETGRAGFGADGKDEKYEDLSLDDLKDILKVSLSDRVFYIRSAMKKGMSVDEIFEITKIDRYFLRAMHELCMFEEEIAKTKDIQGLLRDKALFYQAKEMGYSDRQIAFILKCTEREVKEARKLANINPIFAVVDTCAGEFMAKTPYYYSSYGEYSEPVKENGGKKKIMILGGGPNRIGQGIEFDYCCVHASFALKKMGYESIMVNSNPETVSTDYDTSDKLYFEPLTLEDIMNIYEREKCDGVIVQFGGQTPLNLAGKLLEAGANVIGTSPKSIDLAEDRDSFKKIVTKLKINQPESGIVYKVDDAIKIANEIGYPVLVRPSFVLGGRGMMIVYNDEDLKSYVKKAVDDSEGKAILIDKFLENAIELDVDAVSDGKTTVIGAIMEHVEPAGIHSGDSASIIPPMSLSQAIIDQVRQHTHDLAKELNVLGLMNVQWAIQKGKVYIIEVNPRASRTVPFVSKAIGVPLAQIATGCMLSRTLEESGFTKEIKIPYTAVKEAVFPFAKFSGAGAILSPEMKSTGEVMGIDYSKGLSYLKSQISGGNEIPLQGNIFLSVKGKDKDKILSLAKELTDIGFNIYATCGTSTKFYEAGINTMAVFHIDEGRPNILDLINSGKINWIIKVSETSEKSMKDEMKIRALACVKNIPITTTIQGVESAISGILEKLDFGKFEVCSIQEYHRHIKK